MRSIPISTVLLCIRVSTVVAQNWAPLGQPGVVAGAIQEVNANADRTTLYLCGAFDLDTIPGWQTSNAVLRYSGGDWDTLGTINGLVNSVVQYGDTVVAGGSFVQVDGAPMPYITYRVNGPWQAFGDFNDGIRRLRVIDGVLYAVGSFTTIDGQLVNGVAKRVGGTWQPVGPASSLSEPIIVDVCSFNGDIVIVGSMYVDGTYSRVAVCNGSDWNILGPGISGTFSAATCLSVFQDDLYLGGQIYSGEGNAGQNILRWDGTAFSEVGGSIWLQYGVQSTAAVRSLVVKDSLLFVGGGFRFAGTMPVDGLVTWNGEGWCRIPGSILSEARGLHSMGFIEDSLVIATLNDTLDGELTNYAAKFIGENYADTCSEALAVDEQVDSPPLQVFTSEDGLLQLVGLQDGIHRIMLYDALGRLALDRWVTCTGDRVSVDLSFPSHGLYSVRISGRLCARVIR